MQAYWLGRVPYRHACELQKQLVSARLEGVMGDTLLLLEHPPTITLGRGADPRHVLADEKRLAALGVEVVESPRGGDVTFHGPGQLVGYPIIHLQGQARDVHAYLRRLEEALIQVCAGFGVVAGRFPPHTGVWVRNRKIAAIGIHIRRWVTSHGFALNVRNMQEWFNLIVPCGIRDYGVTSLEEELGEAPESSILLQATASALRGALVECSASDAGAAARDPKNLLKILAKTLDTAPTPVLDW